jgi:hypothetical protein
LGDWIRRHESTRPVGKVLEAEPESQIRVAAYQEDIWVISCGDMFPAETGFKMTLATGHKAEIRKVYKAPMLWCTHQGCFHHRS